MSILLFSNDKCFYYHILVCQGRIPLILLLLFFKKIQRDAGKPGERTTDIQSSKYIPGWRFFLR